jgi:hypothetical protein
MGCKSERRIKGRKEGRKKKKKKRKKGGGKSGRNEGKKGIWREGRRKEGRYEKEI